MGALSEKPMPPRSRLPHLIALLALLGAGLAAALGPALAVPVVQAQPLLVGEELFPSEIFNYGGWTTCLGTGCVLLNGYIVKPDVTAFTAQVGVQWPGGQCFWSDAWRLHGPDVLEFGAPYAAVYLLNCDGSSETLFSGNNFTILSTVWHYMTPRYIRGYAIGVGGNYTGFGSVVYDGVSFLAAAAPGDATPTPGNAQTATAQASITPATPGPTNTPVNAQTATAQASITPPTPTPGGVSCDPSYPNFLCNGNFELPPDTPHNWTYFNNSQVLDQNATDSGGLAYCGTQFANISGAGITQRVHLSAGTLYFHFQIRRKAQDGGQSYPQVEIIGTNDQNVTTQWIVIDGKNGANPVGRSQSNFGWLTVERSLIFFIPTTGYYDVSFSNIHYTPAQVFIGPDGTPVPLPATWALETDPAQDFQVDDAWLSGTGYKSYCAGGAGGSTVTPAASRTPGGYTPTPGAPTQTPGGPTSTAAPLGAFANCDFENGLAGWTGAFHASVLLAGGPVGPQFARIVGADGRLEQSFQWNGGPAFFTFWIGPGSGGSVHVVNGLAYDDVLWAQSETSPAWKLVQASIAYLAPGAYRVQIQGDAFNNMDVDGLLPAAGGYAYCDSGGAAQTPTAGPTSFVTPTPSHTPTPGPTLVPPTTTPRPTVPTRTPNATWTPSATSSPAPTLTPVPTNTPANGATATSLAGTATAQSGTATSESGTATAESYTPTHTPTPANAATATAQASITPATGTPAATVTATAPPSPSPMPNPTQPPEPAPGADCNRPDNPLNLAWWAEYEVCKTLTWFVWTPDNSQQVVDVEASLNNYEPMGTLAEITAARDTLQGEINQFDWANTGLQSGELPDLTIFFPSTTPNGILTGNLVLSPNPNDPLAFVTTCSLSVVTVLGDAMGKGMCASINWMEATGILNWVQYFFDLAIWAAFLRYIWHTLTVTLPQIL